VTDQAGQQNDDGANQRLKDQMDLLKFLREEAAANREAQRDDADANRKLLTDTFKILSPVLLAIIGLAAFLWYRDLATLKESIKNEAEAEAKLEIQKMDSHIDDTLKAQFQKDEIQRTIKDAAVIATQREAKPLIEAGVKSQVNAAVAQQSGFIERVATEAVNSKVQETVAPLATKVGESATRLQVTALIQQVNADRASAFDQLIKIRESVPPDQRKLISDVATDRRNHILDPFQGWDYPGECEDPLSADYQSRLHSPEAKTQVKAIESCYGWLQIEPRRPRSIPPSLSHPQISTSLSTYQAEALLTPQLANLALTDDSLVVRASAIHTLNEILGAAPGFPRGGLDMLDTEKLRQWWQGNEQGYKALLFLSRAKAKPANLDAADLYDELRALQSEPHGPLRKEIDDAIARLREHASAHMDLADPRNALAQSTCAEVEKDFQLRLKSWDNSPTPAWQDDYGFAEMDFLQGCQALPMQLSHLIQYATTSDLLSRRYRAAALLNKWANLQNDPLDSKSYLEWWARHKSEYEK
jgi:hypothetical protein